MPEEPECSTKNHMLDKGILVKLDITTVPPLGTYKLLLISNIQNLLKIGNYEIQQKLTRVDKGWLFLK